MGKFIKKFLTHNDYIEFAKAWSANDDENSEHIKVPNVSLCADTDDMHYNPLIDFSNGHSYVDLDLPSGNLWATMNFDAESEVDCGGYYAWGEGSPKDEYSWDTYWFKNTCNTGDNFFDCNNGLPRDSWRICENYGTCESDGIYYDNYGSFLPDIIRQKMGGCWMIPTEYDLVELFEFTDKTNVTESGVNCVKLSSTVDSSKYILLPCGGYMSGSTLNDTANPYLWASAKSYWPSGEYPYYNADGSIAGTRSGSYTGAFGFSGVSEYDISGRLTEYGTIRWSPLYMGLNLRGLTYAPSYNVKKTHDTYLKLVLSYGKTTIMNIPHGDYDYMRNRIVNHDSNFSYAGAYVRFADSNTLQLGSTEYFFLNDDFEIIGYEKHQEAK